MGHFDTEALLYVILLYMNALIVFILLITSTMPPGLIGDSITTRAFLHINYYISGMLLFTYEIVIW